MAEPHGDSPRSPVSRTVTVSTLPTGGFPVRIDATAEERGELAEAHGLSSVESFHADLELKRWRKDGVRMRGTIRAEIVQECIVTLEPVVSKLDIPVDAVFLPEDSPLRRPLDDDGALIVDPEGPDIPETFEGGTIDAGAIAEEFFELAIDPYPRAPGAELDEVSSKDDKGDEDADDNPFARLAALRDKL
ncbi:MAG: metal-binding protein [Ahrensia sp.]|nr:metal-binding protein [Ahrensia sp.]|tara:strand:- start:48239 stop:48808 length:570 start_codon:yes stop_codon:yes gene_type:complete